MPNTGDIKKVYKYYTWVICPRCNQGRWVNTYKIQPLDSKFTGLCKSCSDTFRLPGVRPIRFQPSWRSRKNKGYILVRLPKDDFFYSMCDKAGYVREHRLVMAKHIGRNLHIWEVVHHKNGIRDDNRYENLQLFTDGRHQQISILENKITHLEQILSQNNIKY